MKNKSTVYWVIIIISFILTMFAWQKYMNSNNSDIISRNGIHWHPELSIYVKGEKQEIPANIGIGFIHQPIHTHDDSEKGILHMEFEGLVRKQETTFGQFLKNWGKDINSFGDIIKMTVNGVENNEHENYLMQDKDKIELFYE